jgi:predicted O-methyltransferase YrrM
MYKDLLQYNLRIDDENLNYLGMINHHHPLSITENEFYFIKDYVSKKQYKSAYEVATGFGISACAIGLGLKTSGGKLISMDAYIEEKVNLAWGYQHTSKETYQDSDGYKTAISLRKHFNLEDTIKYYVGWSPDDVNDILGNKKLDFAFIDAAHFDSNLLMDIEVIKDRMVTPFTVMLHDTQAFSKETLNIIGNWFNTELILPKIQKSFNLGYYLC